MESVSVPMTSVLIVRMVLKGSDKTVSVSVQNQIVVSRQYVLKEGEDQVVICQTVPHAKTALEEELVLRKITVQHLVFVDHVGQVLT